jgi:hypothetical protein
MKTATMSIFPAGYGHNKITVYVDEDKYTTTTSNTRLTDRIKGNSYESADDPKDYLDAIKEAVELCLNDNGVEYNSVIVEYSQRFDHVITINY